MSGTDVLLECANSFLNQHPILLLKCPVTHSQCAFHQTTTNFDTNMSNQCFTNVQHEVWNMQYWNHESRESQVSCHVILEVRLLLPVRSKLYWCALVMCADRSLFLDPTL